MNLSRVNRADVNLVKRMAEIHKFFYENYERGQYFWIMRLETGNIITRGINLITKFLITEDYNLLMDPKNSKSMFGFFASHFSNVQNSSKKSLLFETGRVIEEKSTEISFRNENELAALAPKNFYQNLLMQYKNNQKMKDNNVCRNSQNKRGGIGMEHKKMKAKLKMSQIKKKKVDKDEIKKKFDIYYQESRRKKMHNNNNKPELKKKHFFSFEDKNKKVPKIVDFEKLKLKKKRMNSISGYKFYPSRFGSQEKKKPSSIGKKSIRSKNLKKKKISRDFFKKFSKTLEPEKEKKRHDSRLRNVLVNSSISTKNKNSYFIPFYKPKPQHKIQQKVNKRSMISIERKRRKSKIRNRMKSFGHSRFNIDESRRYRSNKRNKRGKSFGGVSYIGDFG